MTPANPEPEETNPDVLSHPEIRDFIMGIPDAAERIQVLNKLMPENKDSAEWWIPYTGKQQYQDFDEQANYEYFKKHYTWLSDSSQRLKLDTDDVPEDCQDFDEFISRIPDDEWDQFVEDVGHVKEGTCMDDDRASNLEMEAADEWWKPPHGGYDDYLEALKLKFRSGYISHVLDSLEPHELLEVASQAGYYIERQGEGSVWMDCDKVAENTDLEDIEAVVASSTAWRRQQAQEDPAKQGRKDMEELRGEWLERKNAAWHGDMGREFVNVLRKTSQTPEDREALARYNDAGLWEVFNLVMDEEAEDMDQPFFWTVPEHEKDITNWVTTPAGDSVAVPAKEKVPATVHLTQYYEIEPGQGAPRWAPQNFTREGIREAAELAWEHIRAGRRSHPKEHPEFKFESTDPKDFILDQTPDDKFYFRHYFGGQPDSFWGIVGPGEVDAQPEGHTFERTGHSAVEPYGYADELQHRLGKDRVVVFGFHGDENPTSWIGREHQGADFAVVDGRYIVDPWLEVVGETDIVFDLQDPADAEKIAHYYGDKSKWESSDSPEAVRRGLGEAAQTGMYVEPGMAQDALEIIRAQGGKARRRGTHQGCEERSYVWAQLFDERGMQARVKVCLGAYAGETAFATRGDPHVFLRIDGKIFDPTAFQYADYPAMDPAKYSGKVLGEAVDPKDFILGQPDEPKLGDTVRLACPKCQKTKLLLMNWPPDMDHGWGYVCPCGEFVRYRSAVKESVDPKDFILGQPEFSMRVKGLRNTRHLPIQPSPYEMVNNMYSVGWNSVTLSEPSPENATWELRFNRTSRMEIEDARLNADARAFNDVLHQVVYHFDGYLGVDLDTTDNDYDYVATITQLTPTAEGIDPKDFIMGLPESPVQRFDSKPGKKPEYVEFQVGKGSSVYARWIAQLSTYMGDNEAGEQVLHPVWFVYEKTKRKGFRTIGQYTNKDEAVARAKNEAEFWADAFSSTGDYATGKFTEAIYKGPRDPSQLSPAETRDWLLTGGPDVGVVLHHSPTLYVLIPRDKETYTKYLNTRQNYDWKELSAPGDIIIVVPDPDETDPGADAPIGIREYYNSGLEVFENGESLDDVYNSPYGDELKQVLTKHYQRAAREAKREGDDEAYSHAITCLAQVGGHEALRGHYRHIKPGTMPQFDWRYGMTLARRGRITAAARWLREPKDKIKKDGILVAFGDWDDVVDLFGEDRNHDYKKGARDVFGNETHDWFTNVWDNEVDIGDALGMAPPECWAEIRRVLTWATIRVPDYDGEPWGGLTTPPGAEADGTAVLTPAIMASLTNDQIEEMLKDGDEFDYDGKVEEVVDALEQAAHRAEESAYIDATFTGYIGSVESALGSKYKWQTIGGKEMLTFLIKWDHITDYLTAYYDENGDHFNGPVEDLVTAHAERAIPNDDYYPNSGGIKERFKDNWDMAFDGVEPNDPPGPPPPDPNQPELFAPQPGVAGEPVKPLQAAAPPPAPGLGESARDFILNQPPEPVPAQIVSDGSGGLVAAEFDANYGLSRINEQEWEQLRREDYCRCEAADSVARWEALRNPEVKRILNLGPFEVYIDYRRDDLGEAIDPKEFIAQQPRQPTCQKCGTLLQFKGAYYGDVLNSWCPQCQAYRIDADALRDIINVDLLHQKPVDESLLMEGYNYACTLIELPPTHADFLLGWGKANITDEMLWNPPDEDTMGRELEPHITAKYGITLNEVPHELHQLMDQTPAFPVYMGVVSLFQQADHDVVKIAVESPWLRQLNARITKTLPCSGDKHPSYNPHCTIAYVQKGSCDHLVGQDPFKAEGSPGAEWTAYGMLFKGASENVDGPRVQDHLLFSKSKKPEPPLDELTPIPVREAKRPERLKLAAIRMKDGKVITGRLHGECLEKAIRLGLIPGMPTDELVYEVYDIEPGFVTNTGRFLNREEAFIMARDANLVSPSEYGDDMGQLHASDVWEARPKRKVIPKDFIMSQPDPKRFYAKMAFSELGTGCPDIYLGQWGSMSVERPVEPFKYVSSVANFNMLDSLRRWVQSRYGDETLKLLRIEPVYESILAGVGPFETLPFPADATDLIRFLRSSRKRPLKTLL